MPTPAKPYAVLVNEKKSHRTKAEMSAKKRGEDSLKTSGKFKERPEVKENPAAHKEFKRLQKILSEIDKNDAIYEAVINRYCMLQAECLEVEERRETYRELLGEIRQAMKCLNEEDKEKYILELAEITSSMAKISNQMAACDKILGTKRKMLLDIEKENIMTIAAALRSIPKNVEKEKHPLLAALEG